MNAGYDRTNASTQQSGNYGGSNQSTTDKIKDMASDYVSKAREGKTLSLNFSSHLLLFLFSC